MFIRSFILSVSGRGLPHIFLKHHGKVIRGAEAAAIGYFINGIIDFETALDLHPDLVLAVGMSPTGEGHKALMEEDMANNPEYWNAIEAIASGDIIYLPVYFISSAGINVVDHITELADLVNAHFTE